MKQHSASSLGLKYSLFTHLDDDNLIFSTTISSFTSKSSNLFSLFLLLLITNPLLLSFPLQLQSSPTLATFTTASLAAFTAARASVMASAAAAMISASFETKFTPNLEEEEGGIMVGSDSVGMFGE